MGIKRSLTMQYAVVWLTPSMPAADSTEIRLMAIARGPGHAGGACMASSALRERATITVIFG